MMFRWLWLKKNDGLDRQHVGQNRAMDRPWFLALHPDDVEPQPSNYSCNNIYITNHYNAL